MTGYARIRNAVGILEEGWWQWIIKKVTVASLGVTNECGKGRTVIVSLISGG